jgi:hypothetical protein
MNPWTSIQSRLSRCRNSLKQWVRKQVQPVEEQIKQKEQVLKEVQMQASPKMVIVEEPIKNELNAILE